MTAQTKKRRSSTRTGTGARTGKSRARRAGKGKGKGRGTSRWSAKVSQSSDALQLEPNVFKQRSPRAIAESLKRSAERSTRRKAEPYRSALSMLTFYINRAGSNLSTERKGILTRAKQELRKAFGRDAG